MDDFRAYSERDIIVALSDLTNAHYPGLLSAAEGAYQLAAEILGCSVDKIIELTAEYEEETNEKTEDDKE